MRITAFDEASGCATRAQAWDSEDRYAVDTAAMISDPQFVAKFAFGRLRDVEPGAAGTGFDSVTPVYLIDRSDVGRQYGGAPEVAGCRHVRGARYTAEMVWVHEAAHALSSYNEKYLASGFSDPVMAQENAVQLRSGRPMRPAASRRQRDAQSASSRCHF